MEIRTAVHRLLWLCSSDDYYFEIVFDDKPMATRVLLQKGDLSKLASKRSECLHDNEHPED